MMDQKLVEFTERQLDRARRLMKNEMNPIFVSWMTSVCKEDKIAQCMIENAPLGLDLDQLATPIVLSALAEHPKMLGVCISTLRISNEEFDTLGIKGDGVVDRTISAYTAYLEDDFQTSPISKLIESRRAIMVLCCDNRGNQIEGLFFYRHTLKMGGKQEIEYDTKNRLTNIAVEKTYHVSQVFDFAVQQMMASNDGT